MVYFTAKAASKYPFYPDEIFNWDQVNVGKETKGPQYCEQIHSLHYSQSSLSIYALQQSLVGIGEESF